MLERADEKTQNPKIPLSKTAKRAIIDIHLERAEGIRFPVKDPHFAQSYSLPTEFVEK